MAATLGLLLAQVGGISIAFLTVRASLKFIRRVALNCDLGDGQDDRQDDRCGPPQHAFDW